MRRSYRESGTVQYVWPRKAETLKTVAGILRLSPEHYMESMSSKSRKGFLPIRYFIRGPFEYGMGSQPYHSGDEAHAKVFQ